MRPSRQNIEPEELTCKILKNKELLVRFGVLFLAGWLVELRGFARTEPL